MFNLLEDINRKPEPFEFYTAADLWTDEHISEQMLSYHLDPGVDLSSRKGEFIDKSVKWIRSHLNIGPDTRIADFGCGPGLYSSRLAKCGARVTGTDFSKRSISYAREEAEHLGLSIEYINQNYLDYRSEKRFDIILMIMCDYCALSPSQRMVMLKKFKSLLQPGGSVLLDVYSLDAFKQREEAGFLQFELYGNVAGAPFNETDSEFAILASSSNLTANK